MRYSLLTSSTTYIIQYFLLQETTDIQENIILYSETVINTDCRRIQVSVQKIFEHVSFFYNTYDALRQWDFHDVTYNFTLLHMGHTK
jgi:hypothetical protein